MPEIIEEVIKVIKDLPLNSALAYLAAQGILHFSKKGLEKLKRVIQDKHNESKYAFVPNKTEAVTLKEMCNNPSYKQVEMLVPKYRYIDLIRTGLLIAEYHKNDTRENDKRTHEIKLQIGRRPNSRHLLKIVNLPATPFFSVILKIMYDLKLEGYSQTQLEDKFDELISEWDKNTFFVERVNKEQDVVEFCISRMKIGVNYCVVLGMRSAAKKVEDGIKIIDEDKIFQRCGYEYRIIKRTEGNQPRVEVTIFKNA